MTTTAQTLEALKIEMRREQDDLGRKEREHTQKARDLERLKQAYDKDHAEVTKLEQDITRIRGEMGQHQNELRRMQQELEKIAKR